MRKPTPNLTLEEGKDYGYLGNIVLVDQLCIPNKSLIFPSTETIDDIAAANRFGTSNIEEYSFWARRSCGIAIVTSILKSNKSYTGTIYELVRRANDSGGYTHKKDLGWKHQALVDILKDNSIDAEITTKISIDQIKSELFKGHMFIASTRSRNSGSHMILIYKMRTNSSSVYFSLLDTWNLDGKGGLLEMDTEEFARIFLGRGILVKLDS